MTELPVRRALSLAAGLLCLTLAACSSTKKSGYHEVVDYTTPNTTLSQEEYPFDENGNYLADVVSGKTKGKRNKKTSAPEPVKSYTETYETPPEPVVASSTNYETPPAGNSAYAPVYAGGSSGSPSSSRTSSGSSFSTGHAKPKPASSSSSSPSRPKPKTVAKTTPKPKPKPAAKPSTTSHTIKKGDTLYSLANRYGTSVAAIKRSNGLSSDLLRDGRTLRIPR